MLILELLLILVFGEDLDIMLILEPLRMLGRCAILKKCGYSKSWQGFIPLYGNFLIAKCVGREVEGRLVVNCLVGLRLISIALILL